MVEDQLIRAPTFLRLCLHIWAYLQH